MTVRGPTSTDEVDRILASWVVADVIPLLSGERYARQRRWRRLMHAIAWGLSVLIALGLAVPVYAFLGSPVDSLVDPDVVQAATLDRLPPGTARLVRLGGVPVLLVRLDDERLFALGATCTHMDDCLLEWSQERQQIVCPCHGCTYDIYGNVVAGPPSVPLAAYIVERIGDDVFVRRERHR